MMIKLTEMGLSYWAVHPSAFTIVFIVPSQHFEFGSSTAAIVPLLKYHIIHECAYDLRHLDVFLP